MRRYFTFQSTKFQIIQVMTKQNPKQPGKQPVKKQEITMDDLRHTWTVMKPFVRFSIKAMRVIAHALIFIVKNISVSLLIAFLLDSLIQVYRLMV